MNCSDADMDLVARLIRKEKEAWEEFVERYSEAIVRLIGHSLGDRKEDVGDLCNSVFLALMENECKKLRQFEGRCSLKTWLRTIAARMVVDHVRKTRCLLSLSDENPFGFSIEESLTDPGSTSEEMLLESQRKEIIRQVVGEISPEDRLLLKLAYGKEMPAEAIASVLTISVEAVYTRKNRLIEKLRKALRKKNLM